MEEVQQLKKTILGLDYPDEKLALTETCLMLHKELSWIWTDFM